MFKGILGRFFEKSPKSPKRKSRYLAFSTTFFVVFKIHKILWKIQDGSFFPFQRLRRNMRRASKILLLEISANGSFMCSGWFYFYFVGQKLIEALSGLRAYFESAKEPKIVILNSIIPVCRQPANFGIFKGSRRPYGQSGLSKFKVFIHKLNVNKNYIVKNHTECFTWAKPLFPFY